ncbi:MAG: hypothetical protein ACTTJW_04255 [Sphaerochaeta sp.]
MKSVSGKMTLETTPSNVHNAKDCAYTQNIRWCCGAKGENRRQSGSQ